MADVTECPICMEVYANPKILPCVHTFCLECLEKCGRDKKAGDKVACPICRNEYLIPDGGLCGLAKNFFIDKMVQIRNLSETSTNEALCATCPEEERVTAKLFCFECEQNLCERCGTYHKKIRLCQNHQVVEIGKKSQEVTIRNSYCDQHPGELVKMYCEDDEATMCFLCFAESHQSHKCLSVAKASEVFKSALKSDLETVKSRLPECKDSLEKLEKLKTGLVAETTEVEKNIYKEAKMLKALIDTHANILTGRLIAIKHKKLMEIERTMQEVERFQITIETYTRYLDELLNKGSPGDICREANLTKTRAQELAALPGICCGCDFCWNQVVFKASNLEGALRVNCYGIVNPIGDMETGSAINELLGHSTAYPKQHNITKRTSVLWRPVTVAAKVEDPSRAIVVQNIPAGVETDILRMVFDNPRWGGGDTEQVEHEKDQGTALITFKDSAVADDLALKGSVSIGGIRLLIKKC